ncbi:MAG: protein-glutamate O-methyltransferase CheR [Desulfuromonadales bacterium]|nr:protein-glutamate O-methyltransferase CheR [Desulfuromonadales bacterium]NIR33992.1 protein-glutamate O-methyltransferase CheR [Desulfuromonadales bacterium]NIS42664.1 protein-glutamate O-methyltransferase CheR [Desulfuromonadales bacterium]
MLFLTPEIPMSDEEFLLLRDFVYQHCGLHFSEDNKYLLEKRLGKRLQAHRLKSFKDYYYFLRYNQKKEQELAEVINALTTNETYFFREDYQLKTFVNEIIPEVVARRQREGSRKLRVWSAGCSSGEEAYTIAMLLLEKPELAGWDIDIIGTDISQRVLGIARSGIYGQPSFRSTESAYLQKYFQGTDDGKYRICDRVKELVTISYLNLFDRSRVGLLGHVDVIFCRNVIIYFDIAAKKRVVEGLYERLRPEGFLLLGHSESLMNISTSFVLRHFANDMVYQRPQQSSLEERGDDR